MVNFATGLLYPFLDDGRRPVECICNDIKMFIARNQISSNSPGGTCIILYNVIISKGAESKGFI